MKEIIAIVAVCLAAYANSLDNGFHYDDEHSIQRNIHIRDLGNIPLFFKDPSTFSVDHDKGMFRPLLLVTYALNYAWGGYEVFGYHLVNLALHAATACLVMWLARLFGGGGGWALGAGLLFAVHPVCSEPVNYISSRSESLAGLCYMAGIALFIRATRQGGGLWLYGSWGVLVAGLLSKATVITVPAVVLLWDFLHEGRRSVVGLRTRFVRWHLVYWLIAATYVVVIVGNRFLTRSLDNRVRETAPQLLTQVEALVFYLKLLVWPHGLNVEHQFFVQQSVGPALLLAGLLLVGAALALAWAYRRRWDLPLFLNLWALLALAPTLVMPLNVLVNERRLYIPCAAFCLLLAWALRTRPLRRRAGPWAVGQVLTLLLVLGYGLLTFERNQVWQTDFSLWTDAVAKAPKMPRNHLYLGNAHKDAAFASVDEAAKMAHWERARAAYRQTIENDPQNDLALRALNNLGAVSFVLQDIETAEKAYRRAVELNPNYADALVNLGTTYHEKGRRQQDPAIADPLLRESVEYYRRALKLLPNHADAWANMGLALFELREYEKAIKAYKQSYYLKPDNVNLINNFGNYYATLGQLDRGRGETGRDNLHTAERYFQQALRLNPYYASSKRGLEIVRQLLAQ